LAAFNLLVKSLASAYWQATGRRPNATYNDSYEQGYSPFWRLVEIVLPVVAEVTAIPQPPTPAARAKQITRILKPRKHLYSPN
jgi:hypothetical protein